jgi:hypothetical protein
MVKTLCKHALVRVLCVFAADLLIEVSKTSNAEALRHTAIKTKP